MARPTRRPLSRLLGLLCCLALALGSALLTAPAATAGGYLPVPYSEVNAFAVGNLNPATAPPGANDWSCKPSAAHPRPVILVHGVLVNERINWDSLSPLLYDNGYCVFTLNYGGDGVDLINNGVIPIEDSAPQLSSFVDQVLTATGASQVDLVGHSEGGIVSRYYLKNLGGAAKVHTLVTLDSPHYGGTLSGLVTLEQFLHTEGAINDITSIVCQSCPEMYTDSPFLASLNAGVDTVPGVQYTAIASQDDELASPYGNDFLNAAPNVNDITLQNGCPFDFSGHIHVVFDPRALTMVLNALDPAHPQFVPCLAVAYTG